jgi:hypothetical protein
MTTLKTRVCILGAGAGGIGCAYGAVKNGIDTVVVDRNPDFGGTMVFSGVDGWEPGVSLDGLHEELYRRMAEMEKGCHVVAQVPNDFLFDRRDATGWDGRYSFAAYPWALALGSDYAYTDTFRRVPYRFSKRLQFEPSAMVRAVRDALAPYGEHLTALFGTVYESCAHRDGRITSVTVSRGEEKWRIEADVFVDATGDILLARDAGCAFSIGTEGAEDYHEPSAKEKSDVINAVSYVFRIAKAEDPAHVDGIPPEYAALVDGGMMQRVKSTVAYFVEYPNGDFNVNMLPTMSGREYLSLGERADAVGHATVWAYWSYLQREKGMQGYTLVQIYGAGVRESYRLVGKYVLKEQDLRAGKPVAIKTERTIAIADHALDVHGEGSMCKELERPYEIPIECTVAKEFDNLFVCCRGASFSHIAASSARLSRTLLSMGEGVGEYLAEQFRASKEKP